MTTKYTEDHEYIRLDGATGVVGITNYAQDQLGDIVFVEGAPARENTTIFDMRGSGVGRITSGGFSPSLNRAIALGFVTPGHEAPGTQLQVEVRGRLQPATVAALPFVSHRYVRKATA